MNIWKVPLAEVALGPEEIAAVTEVLKSGWLSMGPQTQEFERRFAYFLGIKHAFAVANGTAALRRLWPQGYDHCVPHYEN